MEGYFSELIAKFLLFKNISHTVNRHNIARVLGIFLDLSAKMRNIHMHMFKASLVLIPPDVAKDLFEGQELAAIARQIHQQPKLDRGQLDAFMMDQNLMPFNINAQVAIIVAKGTIASLPVISIVAIASVAAVGVLAAT